MSVSKGNLISSIRLLCGEPPDLPLPEGLPSSLIFEEINNIESSMLRDADLSTNNRRVLKMDVDLTTDQEEFLVPMADFHAPSYAYLQTDTSSDVWFPIEIVEHSSLGQATAYGRTAVAFSGSPPTGYVSWAPDSSQTLRVWYEKGGDDNPTVAGSSDIGSLYDEHLKMQVVAQCREYLNMEVGVVLKARIVKSEMQWQKYVNRGHQRGLGWKAPAYNRKGRRSYPFLDRTRYFVP